jgi:osmoprotectant transport system permease protein
MAAHYEFLERPDGYSQMAKSYGLEILAKDIISMDSGLMYAAIRDQEVDVIVAYSTDGRIKDYGLRTLEDNLSFFPPYQASYIYRLDSAQKNPELVDAIELMTNKVSEQEMIELNFQVDGKKREVSEVVKEFLNTKEIIFSEQTENVQKSGPSFFYQKRGYLWSITKDHLILSFMALFFAVVIAIPLGILMTRISLLARIVFPIVNIVQTIPGLALLGFLVPILGIGFTPALIALFLYSLLPLVRNTFTGINGVAQNFTEASRAIGLTDRQILLEVEIPLALPIIFAGLRTSAVIVIGTATLAALIGAGGFGEPILRGVSTLNGNLILLGAVPSALLALALDRLLGFLQNAYVSKGIQ